MSKQRIWRFTLVLAFILISTIPYFSPLSAAQEKTAQIIFMHHSTGQGLISPGGARELFTALGYQFWDHGYNGDGLTDPEGNNLGINWDVPGDNTDPDGWYTIFNQPVTDPPSNTFSHMLQYDVIIFKSCFPNADIQSEEQLENYRQYSLSIRDVIDQHPDKLFVALTIPPLVPSATSPEAAARARRWAEYLLSADYLGGHPNLAVFDFYSLLAGQDGFLRADYRGEDEGDSHPNELANRTIAPIFVQFVDQAFRQFKPGAAPVPVQQPPAEETGGEETAAEIVQSSGLFTGFEGGGVLDAWWNYTNDPVKQFTCDVGGPGHSGDQALRLTFDIPAGGNAGCGVGFPPDPGWAEAGGISFYWRADHPDLELVVSLAVADPAHPEAEPSEAAPFEFKLSGTGDTWSQVIIRWSDLVKADWFGEAGVSEFDPANVIWMAFNVGHWEKPQGGTVWIDDIQLLKQE